MAKKVTLIVEEDETQIAKLTAEVDDLKALLEVKAAVKSIFNDEDEGPAE